MQLGVLLIKDLKALFKQKAVIFTLLIPTFLIIGIGILPAVVGVNEPFEVGYLNHDEGYEGMNLASEVIAELKLELVNHSNIDLVELKNDQEFSEMENAVWFPSNFSENANLTGDAEYFMKYSDSDLRASSIMNSLIANQIDTIITEKLIDSELPNIEVKRVYSPDQGSSDDQESRAKIAFPLAYMAFLILILSSSSMRVTGFSSEREAGMMELLLSSVIDRREMVLSKLITGVVYGLASVFSYILGIGVLFLFMGGSSPNEEISFLVLAPRFLTPKNVLIMIFLFTDLAFIGIQILLSAQLTLGKEAGDRFGSMAMMILSFMFYFGTIGDPLSQPGFQLINPFFWAYRISLNLMFGINIQGTLILVFLNIIFSWYLLTIMTRSVEKEDVLFE